jgi:hypothetical protein
MTVANEELSYLLTELAGWYTLNSQQLSDDNLAVCLCNLRQQQLRAVQEFARLLLGMRPCYRDPNNLTPTRSPDLPIPDSFTTHVLNEQRFGSPPVSAPSNSASQLEHCHAACVIIEEVRIEGPAITPPEHLVPVAENERATEDVHYRQTEERNICGGGQLDSIASDKGFVEYEHDSIQRPKVNGPTPFDPALPDVSTFGEAGDQGNEGTITHGPMHSGPTIEKHEGRNFQKEKEQRQSQTDQCYRKLITRFPGLQLQKHEGTWLFSKESEQSAPYDEILDSEDGRSLGPCEIRIAQEAFTQLDSCNGSVHDFLKKINAHEVMGMSPVTRACWRSLKANSSLCLIKFYGRFALYVFYELLVSNGYHNGEAFRRGQLQTLVQQLNLEAPEDMKVNKQHVGRLADIGKKLHCMIKDHFFGDPGYLFALPISLSNDR